jgi:DNA-binding MarR family transcriptional regulator
MQITEEISIGALLGRTSHKMRLLFDKVFHKNKIDLNVEQFVLLKFLECNDGVNQKQLSGIIDRDKTTIARLVSKLEKKNTLLRVNSKDDKRVNNIYITNFGKQLLSDISPILKEIDMEIVNTISKEEFRVLNKVLNKISDKVIDLEKQL